MDFFNKTFKTEDLLLQSFRLPWHRELVIGTKMLAEEVKEDLEALLHKKIWTNISSPSTIVEQIFNKYKAILQQILNKFWSSPSTNIHILCSLQFYLDRLLDDFYLPFWEAGRKAMSEIWLSNILLEEYFLTQDRFPLFGGEVGRCRSGYLWFGQKSLNLQLGNKLAT